MNHGRIRKGDDWSLQPQIQMPMASGASGELDFPWSHYISPKTLNL